LIRPDQSEYAISKGGPDYMGDRLFRDRRTALYPNRGFKSRHVGLQCSTLSRSASDYNCAQLE